MSDFYLRYYGDNQLASLNQIEFQNWLQIYNQNKQIRLQEIGQGIIQNELSEIEYLLDQNLLAQAAIYKQTKQLNYGMFRFLSDFSTFDSMVRNKIYTEEFENDARELLYNINQFYEKNQNQDKIYMLYRAESDIAYFKSRKITTSTFSQISDKEYFSKVLEKIQNCIESASEEEEKEFYDFLDLYDDTKKVYEKIGKIQFIILTDIPENFELKEIAIADELKAVIDKIITESEIDKVFENFENELITSKEKVLRSKIEKDFSILYNAYDSYVVYSLPKECKDFVFYRKNTLTSAPDYSFHSILRNIMNLEKDKKDQINNLNIQTNILKNYLDLHPLFKEDFPLQEFVETSVHTKNISFLEIKTKNEQFFANELRKLDEWEKLHNELLEKYKNYTPKDVQSKIKEPEENKKLERYLDRKAKGAYKRAFKISFLAVFSILAIGLLIFLMWIPK